MWEHVHLSVWRSSIFLYEEGCLRNDFFSVVVVANCMTLLTSSLTSLTLPPSFDCHLAYTFDVGLLQAALSHLPSTIHGAPAASTGFSLPWPATRAEFDKLLQGANQLQQQACSWTTSGTCAFPFTSEENLCFAAGFDMRINGRMVIFTSKRTTGLPANFQCPAGIFQYPYQTGTCQCCASSLACDT
jgi:hypothetical protein